MIFQANRSALDIGAVLLLQHETLTREQLSQVRAARRAAPVEEPRVSPLAAAT